MEPITRRNFALAVGVALAGCAGGTSSGVVQDETETGSDAGAAAETPQTVVRSGLPLADATLPVEYEYEFLEGEVVSGGPPKDGIPSIDEPTFVGATEADETLDANDVVFGVAAGDDVKAYPQNVLVWHELVNDVLDGTPVAVSYCPLTGTAMGFLRGETTFGVSGNLVNNNLVMYDRETDSRWPQVLGTAISGDFQGESLVEFRIVWTTWGRWKDAHPETEVLSDDTGYARDYDSDPYGTYNPKGGYYTSSSTLFPQLAEDDRFTIKDVVVGSRTRDGAIAFGKDALREQGVLAGDAAGTPYLAAYDPTLDTGYVYRNPDAETFTFEDGTVTGPDGEAYAADRLPLEEVYAFDAMWFAWVGFYPQTAAYPPDGGG